MLSLMVQGQRAPLPHCRQASYRGLITRPRLNAIYTPPSPPTAYRLCSPHSTCYSLHITLCHLSHLHPPCLLPQYRLHAPHCHLLLGQVVVHLPWLKLFNVPRCSPRHRHTPCHKPKFPSTSHCTSLPCSWGSPHPHQCPRSKHDVQPTLTPSHGLPSIPLMLTRTQSSSAEPSHSSQHRVSSTPGTSPTRSLPFGFHTPKPQLNQVQLIPG